MTAQPPNPLQRRIRLVAWLSSLGGGLATMALIAGVAHTAADAAATQPATQPATTSPSTSPSSSPSSPTSSTSSGSGSSSSSASRSDAGIGSVDQHAAPHGGSNGS
jgi:hypothetical protein